MNKYEIRPKQKAQGKKRIEIEKEIEALDFMGATRKILEFVEAQNRYIAENEPWKMVAEGKKQKAEEVLFTAYSNLFEIANVIAPFMPETSEKMKKQLETLEPEVLFPRLSEL